MSEQITAKLLLSRGFTEVEKDGCKEYIIDVEDFDMDGNEWAALSVRQGNGSDPDYWNVRYGRQDGNGLRPPDTITLLNGIKRIAKIDALISILQYDESNA